MLAFNNGEADLLLCTTIIESGLDILEFFLPHLE
jgi:transcription-repair coupling factor (superfamily II helicase)